MRVLLVKPNAATDSVLPPLGLGYLAAGIRDEHVVDILNCQARGLRLAAFLEEVERFRPDVLGLQVYSSDRAVVRRYVGALHERRPGLKVVLGGPHPSSVPGTVLAEFGAAVHCAFAGEAERPFARWLGRVATGCSDAEAARGVEGLVWRDGGQVRVHPSTFSMDPDVYGEPAWDLLRPESYPHAPFAAFVQRLPAATIVASRGCPYRCAFCAAGFLSGHRVRFRRPAAIVAEMLRLKHVHGIREIQFADDNLTADPEVVTALCELMLAEGVDLPWSCPNGVRVERLDRPLLALMRRAGCHSLAVGVESGSPRILRKVCKGTDLAAVRKGLQLIREAGIVTVGYFMLGFPGETDAERRATIALALQLPLDRAHFMLYCPLPGTPLYAEACRSPSFQADADFGFDSAIHVPEGTTAGRLLRQQKEAFLRFYLRPHQLSVLLGSSRSPAHFWHLAGRIRRWLLSPARPAH
jgi:radical SAM superfamily enzyme YgiQ (UPF0313 family)